MSEKENNGEISALTRKNVLMAERNKCVKFIVEKEVDIRVMEQTDPTLVIGRKPGAMGQNGQPMSYVQVTAKEMLTMDKKERDGKIARLRAIDELLKEEGDVDLV